MTTFVVVEEGAARVLDPAVSSVAVVWVDQATGTGEVVRQLQPQQFPAGWLLGAAPEQLEAMGVYVLGEPPEAPEGERHTGEIVVDEEGVPAWAETFEPIPEPEPEPVPAEVAMHKVHKAALLTPWGDEGGNLKEAIEAAFGNLPAPSDALARIEWDKAANLVRDGATTAAVVAILGMTEEQRDDLLRFAQSLP